MELTQEILDRYVGGQVEIVNKTYENVGYHYRGEVSGFETTEPAEGLKNLFIHFAWQVKKGRDQEWESDSPIPYTAGLSIYSALLLGDGRLILRCRVNEEVITFFLPGARDDPRPKEKAAA